MVDIVAVSCDKSRLIEREPSHVRSPNNNKGFERVNKGSSNPFMSKRGYLNAATWEFSSRHLFSFSRNGHVVTQSLVASSTLRGILRNEIGLYIVNDTNVGIHDSSFLRHGLLEMERIVCVGYSTHLWIFPRRRCALTVLSIYFSAAMLQ